MPSKTDDLADALRYVFTSPNVSDSNGEAANAVDVLAALADQAGRIADGLLEIAAAIREANP
jgi:hypothetical protein